jgi:flagellar basal-body rod protein FlgB
VLDPTMQAIQTSLDGLAARQRIIAQNLANSETPGYLSQNVNFEDSLSAAMASGQSPTDAAITTSTSSDPTNPNGNNVNVDTQTVALMDTGLRYQLATQSMNNEFNILRDSIRQDL